MCYCFGDVFVMVCRGGSGGGVGGGEVGEVGVDGGGCG